MRFLEMDAPQNGGCRFYESHAGEHAAVWLVTISEMRLRQRFDFVGCYQAVNKNVGAYFVCMYVCFLLQAHPEMSSRIICVKFVDAALIIFPIADELFQEKRQMPYLSKCSNICRTFTVQLEGGMHRSGLLRINSA